MRKYPAGYECRSRLHRIWRAMHARCYNPSHEAFARYRAKRIEVCAEWREYGAFLRWALTNGYSDEFEIDRIDNALGYEPENCRWVTRSTNQRNKSNSRGPVEAFGDQKTPIEWSEDSRCVISYHLLLKRLAAGWRPETAIVVPSQNRSGPRAYSARKREGYRDLGRALAPVPEAIAA